MTNTNKIIGYVGTYTKGESEGIYSFILDTNERTLSDVKVVATLENPTYLAISHDQNYLYSVIKKEESGGVSAFSIDQASGALKFINSEVTAGSPPAHVSLDKGRHFLFSSNYHKGTVEVYKLNENNGAIISSVSVVHHEGSGPDPRQEKAHTHFAGKTPDDRHLVAVELGSDLLLTYRISEDGKLTEVSRLSLPPGSGPRHLAFHPKQPNIAYLMTEFSSEVVVLSYDGLSGSFSITQAVKTIPDEFVENNQGSAIHLSSDGCFVYVGNRGHNSICIFTVDQKSGGLQFLDRVSTEGDWPRDFALDPTEKFLIASNQNSSSLVLFSRNAETGHLELIQKNIWVPDPVCIKF